jgi:hypothetical protein
MPPATSSINERGKKAKKVEILLCQILYHFVRARKICSFLERS